MNGRFSIGVFLGVAISAVALEAPAPARGAEQAVQVFEAYPDRIQGRIELRNRQLMNVPQNSLYESFESVILISNKWRPRQVISVAFKGGTYQLRKVVADACSQWTRYANLTLDFGERTDLQTFREWTTADTKYAADIRIGFDEPGYWSAVGTDSTNSLISPAGEASLNLSGFDISLPSDAVSTIIHECGHAMGAEHEHQSPINGCDAEFRFDDDVGYAVTRDQFGQFVQDSLGRKPGLYTVLAGPPNNWPKAKVDFNLRQLHNSSAFLSSSFDNLSIMKYFFADWMFVRGRNSQCYSEPNIVISVGDIKGIQNVYPADPSDISQVESRQRAAFSILLEGGLGATISEHYRTRLESLQ